ncbi:enoyl-CoA hydratase/isomerase family protein [Pendulispora rubella]|uniref:Enoyl-CoA hydratase/isomerase family protein n=1 Tax=Pendulispora rubella TaxID=2741070 RepID=A0ABZ2KXD7_9BACT
MIFEIKLAHPAKNALDSTLMAYLLEQLREAAGRPVLITGSDNAFSAGLNLKTVSRFDGPAMRMFLDRLEHFMAAVYLYPGPVAAAINGHAIAGGCVLALCCDYRVALADPKIKIGLNEVALGVRFPPRIHTIVSRRVPPQHHERVILGAELFDPITAFELGLLDAVSEDPLQNARDRLTTWGALPQDAYSATKRDLRGRGETDLCPEAEHKKRLDEAVEAWITDDVKNRMLAALRR